MNATVFDQFGQVMRLPLLVDRFGNTLGALQSEPVSWEPLGIIVVRR